MPKIFLDCDGVLADFDRHAIGIFGMNPREYEKQVGSHVFWRELEDQGSFYRDMPVLPDADRLVNGVRHLNPTILTGCPRGEWAENQKIGWANDHFPGVPIICCRSANKRDYASPGDVIIDDWPQYRSRWIEMGGIWIAHTSAEKSLDELWSIFPELQYSVGD